MHTCNHRFLLSCVAHGRKCVFPEAIENGEQFLNNANRAAYSVLTHVDSWLVVLLRRSMREGSVIRIQQTTSFAIIALGEDPDIHLRLGFAAEGAAGCSFLQTIDQL